MCAAGPKVGAEYRGPITICLDGQGDLSRAEPEYWRIIIAKARKQYPLASYIELCWSGQPRAGWIAA